MSFSGSSTSRPSSLNQSRDMEMSDPATERQKISQDLQESDPELHKQQQQQDEQVSNNSNDNNDNNNSDNTTSVFVYIPESAEQQQQQQQQNQDNNTHNHMNHIRSIHTNSSESTTPHNGNLTTTSTTTTTTAATPHVVLTCFIVPCHDDDDDNHHYSNNIITGNKNEKLSTPSILDNNKNNNNRNNNKSVSDALREVWNVEDVYDSSTRLPVGYQRKRNIFLLPEINRAFAYSTEPLLFHGSPWLQDKLKSVTFTLLSILGALSGLLGRIISKRISSDTGATIVLYLFPIIGGCFLFLQVSRYSKDLLRNLFTNWSFCILVVALLLVHCLNALKEDDALYSIVYAVFAIAQAIYIFGFDASPYAAPIKHSFFVVMTVTGWCFMLSYSLLIPSFTHLYSDDEDLEKRLDIVVFNSTVQSLIMFLYFVMSTYATRICYAYIIKQTTFALLGRAVCETLPIEPKLSIASTLVPISSFMNRLAQPTPSHPPSRTNTPLLPPPPAHEPALFSSTSRFDDTCSIATSHTTTTETANFRTHRRRDDVVVQWELHYTYAVVNNLKALTASALNSYIERVGGRHVLETTFVCLPTPQHRCLVPTFVPQCVDTTPLIPVVSRGLSAVPWVSVTSFVVLAVSPAMCGVLQYADRDVAKNSLYALYIMSLLAAACVVPTYRRGLLRQTMATWEFWFQVLMLATLHRAVSEAAGRMYHVDGDAGFDALVGVSASLQCVAYFGVDAASMDRLPRVVLHGAVAVGYAVRFLVSMSWFVEAAGPGDVFISAYMDTFSLIGVSEATPSSLVAVCSFLICVFCCRDAYRCKKCGCLGHVRAVTVEVMHPESDSIGELSDVEQK
eukprot:PhM_4_TR18798/c0_g1_i4/m.77560